MRLDKFICECTGLSRNLAKKALRNNEIKCNGVIINDHGFKVNDTTQVTFNDSPIALLGFRYIMLNKPKNFICSTQDEVHPCVLNLLDIERPELLHIAGRLDVDTTGFVLITDNGKWSHQVTSPKKKCGKRYRVKLAEAIDKSLVDAFAMGVQLKNETQLTQAAQLTIINSHEALLTITEGKYHQVKRMFAAFGNKVIALHRESIGLIELDNNLELGEWRYLTDSEIKAF